MFDGEPIFFRAPHEFRDWLERHHATATECVVGYWKTHTGKPSLRWADAVREALCFGWIDGQGRSIDGERHMQRFTPRKSRRWSAVNVALVAELEAEGRMTEAGRRAFAARDTSEEPYSTSKRPSRLPPEFDERLRRDHPKAAAFWGLHAAELPQDARLLDQRGEAPRDARAAIRPARRGLRRGRAAPVVRRSEPKGGADGSRP